MVTKLGNNQTYFIQNPFISFLETLDNAMACFKLQVIVVVFNIIFSLTSWIQDHTFIYGFRIFIVKSFTFKFWPSDQLGYNVLFHL